MLRQDETFRKNTSGSTKRVFTVFYEGTVWHRNGRQVKADSNRSPYLDYATSVQWNSSVEGLNSSGWFDPCHLNGSSYFWSAGRASRESPGCICCSFATVTSGFRKASVLIHQSNFYSFAWSWPSLRRGLLSRVTDSRSLSQWRQHTSLHAELNRLRR